MFFASSSARQSIGAERMLDIVYLLLGVGCFGLMVGYAKLCSWL
jgi:hypothetical protein